MHVNQEKSPKVYVATPFIKNNSIMESITPRPQLHVNSTLLISFKNKLDNYVHILLYNFRMAQGTQCLHAIRNYMRKVTLKYQHGNGNNYTLVQQF